MVIDLGDALVPVHVPRRHLTAVYGFLAGLDPATPSVDADADGADPKPDLWPVDDLRRFARTHTITSGTIAKVLNVLEATPDTWFSTTQLEQETGVSKKNLKGAFAGLSRHINAHYSTLPWMLQAREGREIDPTYPQAELHYKVSKEQAERWREARPA
jgi:hypothetical protein